MGVQLQQRGGHCLVLLMMPWEDACPRACVHAHARGMRKPLHGGHRHRKNTNMVSRFTNPQKRRWWVDSPTLKSGVSISQALIMMSIESRCCNTSRGVHAPLGDSLDAQSLKRSGGWGFTDARLSSPNLSNETVQTTPNDLVREGGKEGRTCTALYYS